MIEFNEGIGGCGDQTCKACGPQIIRDEVDAAAERARNAYFGGGRHGYVSFAKITPESQEVWRNVVLAALAKP